MWIDIEKEKARGVWNSTVPSSLCWGDGIRQLIINECPMALSTPAFVSLFHMESDHERA